MVTETVGNTTHLTKSPGALALARRARILQPSVVTVVHCPVEDRSPNRMLNNHESDRFSGGQADLCIVAHQSEGSL